MCNRLRSPYPHRFFSFLPSGKLSKSKKEEDATQAVFRLAWNYARAKRFYFATWEKEEGWNYTAKMATCLGRGQRANQVFANRKLVFIQWSQNWLTARGVYKKIWDVSCLSINPLILFPTRFFSHLVNWSLAIFPCLTAVCSVMSTKIQSSESKSAIARHG